MTDLLCTLGPASLNSDVIRGLDAEKATSFRLNLSHIDLSDVEPAIRLIQRNCRVPICLDTEGTPAGEPCLTEKDTVALHIGSKCGASEVALSFARNASDIQTVFKLVSPGTRIIAKIECQDGLDHLGEIARAADALLIDRGDLSREVPWEEIPRWQATIIDEGIYTHTPVYVATNFVDSMLRTDTLSEGVGYSGELRPSAGEVSDIWNTLSDGASGLVLAGETAIGVHPVETAHVVGRIIREFWRRPSADSHQIMTTG